MLLSEWSLVVMQWIEGSLIVLRHSWNAPFTNSSMCKYVWNCQFDWWLVTLNDLKEVQDWSMGFDVCIHNNLIFLCRLTDAFDIICKYTQYLHFEKTHSFITSPQVHLSRPNISCLAFPRQQNQTVNTCTTDRYTIMPPQESPGLSLHLVCHFHHLMSFPFHHVMSVFAFLSFLCRIAFL